MARARNGTASSIDTAVRPMVEDFVTRLVAMVTTLVKREVAEELERLIHGRGKSVVTKPQPRTASAKKRVDSRSFQCRAPGCTNTASPRFQFLCKEHRQPSPEQSVQPELLPEHHPEPEARSMDDAVPEAAAVIPEPISAPEPQPEPVQEHAAPTTEDSGSTAEPAPTAAAEDNAPTKDGCSVPDCTHGWFRPSGKERKLCRRHWLEQRTAAASPSTPEPA